MSRIDRKLLGFGEPRRRWLVAVVLACGLLVIVGVPSQAAAPTTAAGQLYAFGANVFGQLGSTTNNKSAEPNPTPALVTLPGATGPVTQIAVGESFSLAVTSTGQLYAFGDNEDGQLGSATNNESVEPNPTPALVTLPGATGAVTQVAAGESFSLAVTSTGQLYAFGENYFGQLGNATNNETEKPNPTPTLVTLPGASGPVTQVAAGEYQSLAVTSTGQLYAFGNNASGELGSTTNNETSKPNPTPTLVTLPGATGPVTHVAAGEDHTLAVTLTGQLYAFGANYYGQLGSTTRDKSFEPNPLPTLVTLPGASGPVTEVAAGAQHSLVVTSSGQLYAFGEDHYGQLGSTANTEPNPTPTLVALPGATGAVTEVAAGERDSLAVTSSGQLYAFGQNNFGQLGRTADSEPNPTPTLVAIGAATTVDTVARGPEAEHTLVLVADLAVSSGVLSAGQVGVPYSQAASAAGGTTPYSWSAAGLPAGLSINAASGKITGTPTTAGSANVTLTVTDAFGIIATSAVIPLTIAPAAKAATPPPTLTAVSVTHKRFRVAKQATAISAKKQPLGTSFRFTLSAAARLQITLTTTAAGLRHGHSCLAPSAKLRRAHAKHCTRTISVATLTRANEPRGRDSVAFSGRIGRRALSPRGYTARLTASNIGGRSKAATLSFTIVR